MTHAPWNSMLYSMEVWCRQMKYHLVPYNSMELWDCHFIQCHATLNFHGIYHGIPWNSIEWPNKNITEFHGIPWNKEGAITNDTGVPWNSMEYSIEFRGTLVTPNDISLSSMEFHGTFHGIHGTLVSPNEVSLSSMEFHGTSRLPFYGILPWLDFQGIFHGIPWNSGVAKWKITEFHGIPWNY